VSCESLQQPQPFCVCFYDQLITVELEKGDTGGLGFTLAGGADTMGGCFVRDIIGDPAKADGRLQKGDQILQVSHYRPKGMTGGTFFWEDLIYYFYVLICNQYFFFVCVPLSFNTFGSFFFFHLPLSHSEFLKFFQWHGLNASHQKSHAYLLYLKEFLKADKCLE